MRAPCRRRSAPAGKQPGKKQGCPGCSPCRGCRRAVPALASLPASLCPRRGWASRSIRRSWVDGLHPSGSCPDIPEGSLRQPGARHGSPSCQDGLSPGSRGGEGGRRGARGCAIAGELLAARAPREHRAICVNHSEDVVPPFPGPPAARARCWQLQPPERLPHIQQNIRPTHPAFRTRSTLPAPWSAPRRRAALQSHLLKIKSQKTQPNAP